MRARLRNFAGTVPHVSGTAVLGETQIDYFPNAAGLVSGNIWGNDVILPAGTFWTFEWWNQKRIASSGNWLITGNTDLDTAAQL